MVGVAVGVADGGCVGASVGSSDGASVGSSDGSRVGSSVGASVGASVGSSVGSNVGTSVGSRDIASSVGLDHPQSSYTVNGLQGDGSTVYVRLRVKIDGSWKVENDYQYTACDCGGAITVDKS